MYVGTSYTVALVAPFDYNTYTALVQLFGFDGGQERRRHALPLCGMGGEIQGGPSQQLCVQWGIFFVSGVSKADRRVCV